LSSYAKFRKDIEIPRKRANSGSAQNSVFRGKLWSLLHSAAEEEEEEEEEILF